MTRSSLARGAGLVWLLLLPGAVLAAQSPPGPATDGDGSVTISGPLQQWHKLALTLQGPFARERDKAPNPFLDYRLTVDFDNAGGDGDNVWPFVERSEKLPYDCSKLDQWQVVFDHAQTLGLYLHFKLQETEIDDNRRGNNKGPVPTALDGGDLGVERKLFCRELIARFAHELALNWNLGEENTQSPEQQRAMAAYLRQTDPYGHHIVVHTYPNAQDQVYPSLLGAGSVLSGASLQNSWQAAHQRTLKWVRASAAAGRPWVVANDEQNPADMGVPPDPGYAGHDGLARDGQRTYDLHDVRKLTLWGRLMAGGGGVEYYFGYKLPRNDLTCQDWRSRDRSWDFCRIALEFFAQHQIPFWEMTNADGLVGNPQNDNRCYCLAKAGEVYVVYLPKGGTAELDLSEARSTFQVRWFDPRNGGDLQEGSVRQVQAGGQGPAGNAARRAAAGLGRGGPQVRSRTVGWFSDPTCAGRWN